MEDKGLPENRRGIGFQPVVRWVSLTGWKPVPRSFNSAQLAPPDLVAHWAENIRS